jgi:hypothetical protein
LIAGRLLNLPVVSGMTTSYPNFGITPPPPNYLLESSVSPPGGNTDAERRWQRRFGVTHGVWCSGDDVRGTEIIAEINDPALDEIMSSVSHLEQTGLGPWKLVRNRDPFPPVRVALRVHEAANWGRLYTELSRVDGLDDAWFLAEDRPPTLPAPVATKSRIATWDGRTVTLEHDGACILIVRRTYYPGWQARINDGPAEPVLKVDGGLQGVRVTGSGTTRVSFEYSPVGLDRSVRVSLSALGLALVGLLGGALRFRQPRSSGK